jgi:glycosyltransferase involved in cell wall biosynthesis
MIEAMACGTPVIAWANGSVPEIVEPGLTGYVVHSLEDAVAAVSKLDRISRGIVRETFEERFTADRMARDYVEIYRGLPGVEAVTMPLPHMLGGHGAHVLHAAE